MNASFSECSHPSPERCLRPLLPKTVRPPRHAAVLLVGAGVIGAVSARPVALLNSFIAFSSLGSAPMLLFCAESRHALLRVNRTVRGHTIRGSTLRATKTSASIGPTKIAIRFIGHLREIG
jgi:hypothetical protein